MAENKDQYLVVAGEGAASQAAVICSTDTDTVYILGQETVEIWIPTLKK